MDEPKLTKICNACKQALGLEMFSKNKAVKDGYENKCRECMKIKQKQQYDKHAEKRREYARDKTPEQRERKKEYGKKYREEHKEELNEYVRQWRKNHPDYERPNKEEYNNKRAAALRERYANDPEYRERVLSQAAERRKNESEEVKAKKRKDSYDYRWKRIEQDREYKRTYYREYRQTETHKAYMEKYKEENDEKIKAYRSNYRAKRGYTSDEHIIRMHQWQENHCYWCNKKMSKSECTVEHIVPISADGSANPYNVVYACEHCNFQHQGRIHGISWEPDFVLEVPRAWSPSGKIVADYIEQNYSMPYCFDEAGGVFQYENGVSFCVLSSFWSSERGNKQAKTIVKYYRDKGVFVFWDDEVRMKFDAVVNVMLAKLNITKRTFARNTTVEQMALHDIRDFLETHHMQGAGRSSLNLALKDNAGEVVAVSTFMEKDDAYELSRLCFDGHVPGGMSKLLAAFAKVKATDKPLVSYADLRFGTGESYSKNGFILDGYTPVPYSYVSPEGIHHRLTFSKQGLAKRADYYDESLTEAILTRANGIFKIHNVPHARYRLD